MGKYDIVIGLEIHAELNTNTKIFCGCANEFGSEPNTNVCEECLGMPGATPSTNKAAVKKTIIAGLAMGCKINDIAIFERKHYFYPDLPSGYQTSQLEKPICVGGGIKLGSGKFMRLNRIHLEEDAGKLVHKGRETLVDYNRAGTPLIEIVTEPDFSSADEVVEFLEEVRSRLIFAGVANCKMEEGGMRCDVNISVKPAGAVKLGNRTETKNLNSFKSVARAIEFESARQMAARDAGETIVVETRKWDDEAGEGYAMRSKEEAHDYRYFPCPNLCAIEISREEVAELKAHMPRLACEAKESFAALGLDEYNSNILAGNKYLIDLFECTHAHLNEPKELANWLTQDLLSFVKFDGVELESINLNCKRLAQLIKLYKDGKITRATGKKTFLELIKNDIDVEGYLAKNNLLVSTDMGALEEIIKKEIAANPVQAADYKNGNTKIIGFFVGKVMKASGGSADPKTINELLAKLLT